MKRIGLSAVALWTGCFTVGAQDTQQLLQQRLSEIRESIADNQARLRAYQWVETTEVIHKGEVKRRDQKECRYGPDGEIQKKPLNAPAEAPTGRKAKRIDELKDYVERSSSLISRYLPRDAARMQEAFQSGKVAIEESSGSNLAALVFRDYIKSGDNVTFTFNTGARKLVNYAVATYLDTPDEAVTLNARLAGLPDGASYIEETVLDLTSKQLKLKITNFGHAKVRQ